MSGFRFPSNHCDHALRWPGFRTVMPTSSETGANITFSRCFEVNKETVTVQRSPDELTW